MVVNARFKYEKLSLFCFICGKLGRRRNMTVSRWLRAADGTQCSAENFAGYCNSIRPSKGRNRGNEMRDADGIVYGAMELVSTEGDDPIALIEGKKGRGLWKVYGFLWMLSLGQVV
ncbi:hypothetical protein Golob_006880 [Gossypium lobatum]|uniref:Zinc knuckle CX2CX4HX4C domain-containing protein n=1 Tax=Gossypium lobatum TaxID=34289 RepID=A0A7J8NEA6_9ROSI|nr:hypothetical protein [Gossypium lobatum]